MGQMSSLSDILGMLRRQAWLIVLVLMIGVPAAALFALSRPQLYEATAVIQIEAPQVAAVSATQPVAVSDADMQLDLIQRKLMARDSLIAVIDRFGIFPADMSVTEQVALLRQAVTITKLVDPARQFQAGIQPSGLAITVRLGNAAQAAAVANAFLEDILAEAQSRSESRAARTLAFFAAEEQRVGADIATEEAAFARFKEANGASLPDGITGQRDQQSRLVQARIAMDQQIIELQTNSNRLREDEVARQADLLGQQRNLIDQNIAVIQTALDAAPEVQRQFSAFDRQLAQLQEEYRVITSRRSEAGIAQLLEEQDQAERFEVLETAIAPEFAVSASRRKLAVAGAVLTGLLAVGLAVVVELLRPAIRTAAQLERQLGVQAVIVIPHLTNRGQARNRRLLWLAGVIAVISAVLLALRGSFGAVLDRMPLQTVALPLPAAPRQ